MKKQNKIIIFIILFLISWMPLYAGDYDSFVKGEKQLGFTPKKEFINQIYNAIKTKYPLDVPDSTLFAGSRSELCQLLKAYKISADEFSKTPADTNILIAFLKKYKEKVSQNLAAYATGLGMVKSLKDKECEIILPSQSQDVRRDIIPESYGGVGVLMEQRDGKIVVIHSFEGGSAKKSGILAGDIITSIGGVSTQKMDLDTAMNRLRGEVDSTVTVEIMRNGKKYSAKLTRAKVELNPIEAGKLSNGMGYIRIVYFEESYPEKMCQILEKFKSMGIKKWVLDLRDNSGGFINGIVLGGSLLIPSKKPLMYIKYKDKDKLFESAAQQSPFPPCAVVVNGYTTGTAEALAIALREQTGAKIFGTTTQGNSSVSELVNLQGGATLRLSVGIITSSQGQKIHGVGVKPDVSIPSADQPSMGDKTINKILEYLK